jgi:hypothetical protein
MAANLAESLARKLPRLRPGRVARYLEALAAAGRRDEQLQAIVCDFVAQQVDHYAKRMQYKSLQPREATAEEANPYDWCPRQQLALLRATNALGYTHPGLLEAVSACLMPTSWAASPETLAYLLYELARAGVRSSALAAQLGENRINPQLAGMSLRQMAAALWGCAQMGEPPGPPCARALELGLGRLRWGGCAGAVPRSCCGATAQWAAGPAALPPPAPGSMLWRPWLPRTRPGKPDPPRCRPAPPRPAPPRQRQRPAGPRGARPSEAAARAADGVWGGAAARRHGGRAKVVRPGRVRGGV